MRIFRIKQYLDTYYINKRLDTYYINKLQVNSFTKHFAFTKMRLSWKISLYFQVSLDHNSPEQFFTENQIQIIIYLFIYI